MHNLRKVKKKKKIKPAILQQKTPQQTLIQISNSRQEQGKISDVDFFILNLEHHSKMKTQKVKKPRKIQETRINERILEEGIRFKRINAVERQWPKNLSNLNRQYTSLRPTSVRFVYLKSPKHSDSFSKDQNKRSKTVCNQDKPNANRKVSIRQFEKKMKVEYLYLKRPKQVNYVPSFIVKHIKLDDRYPKAYIQ